MTIPWEVTWKEVGPYYTLGMGSPERASFFATMTKAGISQDDVEALWRIINTNNGADEEMGGFIMGVIATFELMRKK